MKRLIFAACALAILFTQNIAFPQTADAAAATIKVLDANSLIGMTSAALVKKYGSPVRQEPSEYGFTWFVYSRDLKNFFMAGVQDSKVVAAYTNASALTYRGMFKLNSTRSAVRARLGTPISYIQDGNTICILNNTNQRDLFLAGSNYAIVFYDNIKGGKVTSVLIVPQQDENQMQLQPPALSSNVVAAYQRISVDLINAVRARSGLKTLKTDTLNTRLAVSRSKDMRDRNYFDHYTPSPARLSPLDQARKMGIRYSSFGENIAYGDHNAIFAHEAFMNSTGHRSNVLKSNYTKIGAGVVYGGNRYVLLTNIFTR